MSAGPARSVLVTCEHAGNEVPKRWEPRFAGLGALLESHRGQDPGAADLAGAIARRLGVEARLHHVTRLLADVNRSEGHPRLFGEPARDLPPEERERILEAVHRPHRRAVEADVAGVVDAGGAVLHLGVHSFTPVLDGVRRETGIGLLYDPGRAPERALAAAWAERLRAALPELRVHRNRPYRGVSDGLTTTLRRRFHAAAYLGIEVEVRSDLLVDGGARPGRIAAALADALVVCLADVGCGESGDRTGP